MDIIAKLEKHRLENKIPQQELAVKLGVAFSTVNPAGSIAKPHPTKFRPIASKNFCGAKNETEG